jgi:hypothetical protein
MRRKMRRWITLAVVAAFLTSLAVPASASPEPPPVPNGWTSIEVSFSFKDVTNPCTGETGTTQNQDRMNMIKSHNNGGTTWRRYVNETTSDGWSSNGWVHSETVTRIFPGPDGVINMRKLVIPLYEDGGNGVMFAIHTQRFIMVGNQSVEINSGFELRCASS